MPRRKAAKFRCPKCGKTFAMAMHLGRHMTTTHGQSSKKAAMAGKRQKAPRGGPTHALVSMINKLRSDRQEHLDALARIDAIFAQCGIRPTERE